MRESPFTGVLRLRHVCIAALLVGCGLPAVVAQKAQDASSMATLRDGFQSPPQQARLRCYWWWLNGHTDKATITQDLEEMAAKGIGGALLVDADGAGQEGNHAVPDGPTFGSPAWMELYTHALREADRLGLEITLNITSGWNLGGPDVTPEQSSKMLTWSRTLVHGGAQVKLRLAQPNAKNGFYREIGVLAYPLHSGAELHPLPGLWQREAAIETGFSMPSSDWMLNANGRPARGAGLTKPTSNDLKQVAMKPVSVQAPQVADAALGEVRNISEFVGQDGELVWSASAGDWEVLRVGYTDSDARVSTASGAWQGRAIDYLSRDAFNTYWDHTVEPLLKAAKPYQSLKYLTTDSWELGGTNWTDAFATEFRKRRGYDPVPWLPVVAGRVLTSPDASARFLSDVRRTVADLITENHYDLFQQRASEYGLGVQAESGGPHGAPIDALETFRRFAIPQSEFWAENEHRADDGGRFFTKEAASAANIYGKHFVAQEGETSVGPQWSESLATDLKPTFDMAITEGMNRLVWHEFTSSPAETGLPGQEYFAGTHLNPKVTWWESSKPFFLYLNRVQFLMQQGLPVDDVLYFTGENVPAFVRLKADDPTGALPGYDYDATDEDALLHTLHFENGSIVGPSGVTWKALALPKSGRISLASLRRIEAYVDGGGSVIGIAPTSPAGITSQEDAEAFGALVSKMWGDCAAGSDHRHGAGRVFCLRSAHEALQRLGIPQDVAVSSGTKLGAASDASLDYSHRQTDSADIYFLRNGSSHSVSADVLFRSHSSAPQLWDPLTGEITRAGSVAAELSGTKLRIDLAPFGSTFVVFPRSSNKSAAARQSDARVIPVRPDAGWELTFQLQRGGPASALHASELKSWTESSDPRVRYFSGSVTYTARVMGPVRNSDDRVYLTFQDVREIASVKINGYVAGTVWAKPYELRVDPWLRPGDNELEITVTNLWPNRIIGDLQPGAHEHITSTNITSYRADSPLLPSGLIGEVTWSVRR